MTFVGSLRLTMSSPPIISADGRVPRGTEVMSTSQGLVSKAHTCVLYNLNRAPDGLRRPALPCSEGTREAPSEHQMMVCSGNPYNQRLPTLNSHPQLTSV